MKHHISRLNIIQEYEQAPDTALFTQETVAAIRDCSLATIERDRWAGLGIPFGKALHTYLQQGHKPKNSIYLFLGKDAWQAVKRVMRTQQVLVLPLGCSPFDYYWPVRGCDILAFDTGSVPPELIEKVGYALLIADAICVRVVLQHGMVIYRGNN